MADLKFPIFVDLSDKRILVVGGGKIALRRVNSLLGFGADITVVSPEISEEFNSLLIPEESGLSLEKRCFAEKDLEGKSMVLAATDDAELNHRIVEKAKSMGLWANNASLQSDNNFYFPAIAMNENISVGICGTGKDHAGVKEAALQIRNLVDKL